MKLYNKNGTETNELAAVTHIVLTSAEYNSVVNTARILCETSGELGNKHTKMLSILHEEIFVCQHFNPNQWIPVALVDPEVLMFILAFAKMGK